MQVSVPFERRVRLKWSLASCTIVRAYLVGWVFRAPVGRTRSIHSAVAIRWMQVQGAAASRRDNTAQMGWCASLAFGHGGKTRPKPFGSSETVF